MKAAKLCKCGNPVRYGLNARISNGKTYEYQHYNCNLCESQKQRAIRRIKKKVKKYWDKKSIKDNLTAY